MSAAKFRGAAALSEKIDNYFDGLGDRPPTLRGLALALGFDTLEAMLNYRGKPQIEALLSRARTRVEQYAEERLFSREGGAGARFSLSHPAAAEKPGADIEAVMAEVRARMDRRDAAAGEAGR